MSGFNTIPPNPFPPSTDEDGTQAAQIKHLQEDVSTLQGNVSTLSTTKANQATIAPSFSAETSYSVDDIVYYEGAAYRCTTAHTGAWDANDFAATTIAGEISDVKGDVSDLETTKANQITIAPTFSDSASYDVGDIVYYNGLSYRCTNAHEGAWDASDFAATTIAGELNGLNSNITALGNYAMSEVNTGMKWAADGRDIFRKVISCGALPESSQKLVGSGLSNVAVIDIRGIAISQGAMIPLPYISVLNQHVQLHYSASTNHVVITTTTDLSSYTESYVYILYVKNA